MSWCLNIEKAMLQIDMRHKPKKWIMTLASNTPPLGLTLVVPTIPSLVSKSDVQNLCFNIHDIG